MPSIARERQPSAKDVALLAGVSTPTVSRVFSGSANVSPRARRQVEAAAQRLGYRPNSLARALASGRVTTIAVITQNTARYGNTTTIAGIEEAARAAGHPMVISVLDGPDPQDITRSLDAVLSQQLAGAIVLQFDRAGRAALQALPEDLPVVAVSGPNVPGRSQAVFEEARAGEEATRYLLSLGHRSVAFIAFPSVGHVGGRVAGWRSALRSAGLNVPPVIQATWEARSSYEIGRSLARDPNTTAVFCANDMLAMGLISGLASAGRRVPDDISVIGFDDEPIAEFYLPPLTTVYQDFAALGRDAFGLLKEHLDGSTRARVVRRTPTLVVRGSVGPPPG
jgi:DNA-binding LacI/PurR family transcriptional regulator